MNHLQTPSHGLRAGRLPRALLVSILLCVGVPGAIAGEPAGPEDFSQANRLLFTTDHLGNVNEPRTLHYEFSSTGSVAPAFTDRVELRIVDVLPDGARNVEVEFLTGERSRPSPPMREVRGNPLVMVFLQRDVYEMNRLTGGPWRHFQKRIKLALAESAELARVTIPFDGEEVEATRIRISPYLEDPERGRFEAFAGKFYEFVVSDAVPGSIQQIRAVVPNPAGEASVDGQQTAMEEILVYRPRKTGARQQAPVPGHGD